VKVSSFSVILVFFCLMLAGLAHMPFLPVKLAPSQTLPEMSVNCNLSSNAARMVEMGAASNLEAMFARIKGVESIRSTSGIGWGHINIRFNKHTDKISQIFLTVISTVLGFIPFMAGQYKEAFWFPLAAGTIGGLVVSLFGTFCFLPLFIGVAKRVKS